jgi:hypothetical protein
VIICTADKISILNDGTYIIPVVAIWLYRNI